MKMFGKGKKTVSLGYKNKLLAEIEYYEKRIAETLQRNNSISFSSLDDVESSDEDSNPYTLHITPSVHELKRQEASLESRVSMTLELAMLTIMHSDNASIMTEPPVVRRPVNEEGTWLEVTADCKIDLVAFVITFYAHKPFRKYAPTRYRNVVVKLKKAAHEKELSQSILCKLNRPNLALQVLQSYAAAFRSRRTTLLELAQKYADKIRMEEMTEGGYRVRFLDLLTVDWSLENMWSPVVPFCHRMKFEVEYMPKEYIHTISKLYKQFKDPSLETGERTSVLCQIFDTCSAAQAPARDLQESAESDPDTAGRLHERRTTIDQEPEIPSSYQLSPKKQPKGKENKVHTSKTAMEPPKTIPKKLKKSRPLGGDESNAKKARPNAVDVTADSRKAKKTNDNVTYDSTNAKKNKPNDKEEMVESRKGVKRSIENGTNSNAKKIRSDVDNAKSKVTGEKATEDVNGAQKVKNNAAKKEVSSAKNSKDDTNKKELNSASASSLRSKVADDKLLSENAAKTKVAKDKTKENTQNLKAAKESDKEVVHSKDAEENAGLKKTSNKKGPTEKTVANSVKNNTDGNKVAKNSNNVTNEKEVQEVNTKKKIDDVNTKVVATNKNVVKENVEKNVNKVVTRRSNIVDKIAAVDTNRKPESNASAKNDAKKGNDGKPVVDSRNKKAKDNITKNFKNSAEKDQNKITNAVKSNVNTVKKVDTKNAPKSKESNDLAKKIDDNISSNNNAEVLKQTVDKDTRTKNDGTFTKITDKTFTKNNEANKDPVNKESGQNTVKNNLNAKAGVKLTDKENVNKNNIKDFFTMKQSTKPVSGNINNDKNKKITDNNGPKINKVQENTKISIDTKSNPKDRKDEAKTSNTQNNTKTTNKINNPAKPNTVKGVFQKFTENQSKIAKLTSKIPMMKGKIKISTLTNKLEKIATKPEKTKIPLKSLPVFKKINNPTRMSPRKLPSFKPPKGVSKPSNK